jgi:hypothetical protein
MGPNASGGERVIGSSLSGGKRVMGLSLSGGKRVKGSSSIEEKGGREWSNSEINQNCAAYAGNL